MRRAWKAAGLFGLWLALGAQAPVAAPAPPAKLSLWRLDCGTLGYDEPRKLPWNRTRLPLPCFLIRHGDAYMLWDTGISASALGSKAERARLDRTIVDQLGDIGVRPDQISVIAISHYHGDHTGQAAHFPKARLVIAAKELAALTATPTPKGAAPSHLQPWISGGAPLVAAIEDVDIFGDGRVVAFHTPGHTPGHMSLMVKLAARTVLLSGDLWGSREDVLTQSMPDWSSSRAETAASRERFRRMALEEDAMTIIQHDEDDRLSLPLFPRAAE
ncbi:MAG TPA: N-acyl homoserine lactonase family protein [Allosphingosinicella sp.]|jgi:glyoxylase-like metal-dependent hydrolase (beta-lactamase superfamily II)